MLIETVVVGPFEVNCYLYADPATGRGLIIDPGADADSIVSLAATKGFSPAAILLTHGHGDHIGAVDELRSRYNIPLIVGAGEEALLADPALNVSAWVGMPITAKPPDQVVADEELITPGGMSLRVLATPGHSPGGVCYLDERMGWLFCGDTLFYGSIGRTDLPGSSFEILMSSIQNKILPLPDAVRCFPGHGPTTTVGAERTNNPFITGQYYA